MAMKYFKMPDGKVLNKIEIGILEKIGIDFKVRNNKIFFDEKRVAADRKSVGSK